MVKKDTFFSISRSLIGSFQLFLISMLVIHYTSLNNWGAFISLYLVWSLVVMVVNTGTKDFIVKTISNKPAEMWNILSRNTIVRLLFSFAASLIVLFIPELRIIEKCIMISIIICRVFISSFEGIIVYEKDFTSSFYIELSSLCVILIAVFFGNTQGWLLPHHILIYILIGDLIKIMAYQSRYHIFGQLNTQFFHLLSTLKELAPFYINGSIGLIMNKADLYIFGLLVKDKTIIAQYHILSTLSNLLLVVITSFLLVRSKAIYRVQLTKIKQLRWVYITFSIPIVIGALTIFYTIAPFIFQYRVTVFQLGIIALTLTACSGYVLYFYTMLRFNQLRQTNISSALAGMISIVLSVCLIPRFSIEGALIAVCISHIFLWGRLYFHTRPYFSLAKHNITS